MPFKPGDTKPPNSGRKPGVKNKKTLLKVEEFLASKGVHPVEEILKRLPEMDDESACRILLELMKYWTPQIKPADAPPATDKAPSDEPTASPAELLVIATAQ